MDVRCVCTGCDKNCSAAREDYRCVRHRDFLDYVGDSSPLCPGRCVDGGRRRRASGPHAFSTSKSVSYALPSTE